MIWLKQSTAVVVSFGPALLNSDGVTLVTNLVGTGANQTESTTTGIRLSKNGGAFAARHATATASAYDAFGNYLVTLDTTDTATLGVMRMQYANGAAFCPMWMDFMVVPANVWDSMFGATYLKTDLTAILTTNLTETSAGYLTAAFKKLFDIAVPVLTTASVNQTGDGYARLGAPAGASVSADIAAIRVDTNTTIPNLIAALNNLSSATVKAQVVAALATDTYAEPAQGAPAATTTLAVKIGFLYKAWRNKSLQTATQYSLLNDDAATVDHKAAVSDDGTTFSRNEVASGP